MPPGNESIIPPHPQMQSPQQLQAAQQPSPANPFPAPTSITPTIFTPIAGDSLTKPFDKPIDRIEILHYKLETLNDNYKRVRANMMAFIRRECARHIWEYQQKAKTLRAEGQTSVAYEIGTEVTTEEDLDAMIEMMCSKPVGKQSEEKRPIEIPDFREMRYNRKGISFREQCTLDVEIVISQGLADIDGYEKHYRMVKQEYTELLEREREHALRMDLD